MNSFQKIQTLATHPRFTVFEARGERFQFPVVLKRCECREVSEAEFFLRSALMKAKAKAYSRPLLSIFADVDDGKTFIVFVWQKGNALDTEVERDEESSFPPGKAGYVKSKVLYKNALTKEAVKRALCQTLGREVVLKTSKRVHMLEMNSVFREALTQARCAHPNVCDFLDFRLYLGKNGHHCSYIVMESLEQDLAMEIQERKLQPYDEVELMTILQQVIAALLNAKRQEIAHQDIKPQHILRGPQGLKLADFGATCHQELHSRTSSAIGTEMYTSPETSEAMGNPEVQQRPFESDVFSLGMTMLHLAAMELPERTSTMRRCKLQTLLQRKVQALRYSKRLKRLLTAMLSTAPSDRPPLEAVQVDAERIYRIATQKLAQEAHRLRLQAKSSIDGGKDAMGIELAAAAHACLAGLGVPEDKDTAINLFNWGSALSSMKRSAEAVEKHAAAHAIFSRLPEDKSTASNLGKWGFALRKIGRDEEVVEKYAAAHAIYSRFPEDKDTAINLKNWGFALNDIGRNAEAVEKYAAAHAIFSQLPENKDTAINLSNWGDALNDIGRGAEAVEKHTAAHAIFSRLPENKDTAINLYNWGNALSDIERSAEAVEKHAAAHAIFSRLPEDKDTAYNLYNWGYSLDNLEMRAEAVEKYAAAHAIFSRLPEDKDAADNLFNWGCALNNMGRSAEAVEKYAAAHVIYSRLPEDKDTAVNLYNWGFKLNEIGMNAEGVEKYAAAHAIFSRLPEDKDTAYNLFNWGFELNAMGRSAEAVEKYTAAHAIFSRLQEDKMTAINLFNWGNALDSLEMKAEALEKYAAAHAIYSRLPVDKDTADNMFNWGFALTEMGRSAEAVEKHATAHTFFSQLSEDKDTAYNLYNWGYALNSMGRCAEAVEKYETARAIYASRQLDRDVSECDAAIAKSI